MQEEKKYGIFIETSFNTFSKRFYEDINERDLIYNNIIEQLNNPNNFLITIDKDAIIIRNHIIKVRKHDIK